MPHPTVSFIIPCYNLGHLLPVCIQSILSQTYSDFEVLIMDDCSPDDTAVVAKCFSDCRVHYIRNERNLGHLRNYNKGIAMSRGRYVWLISADDYLRQPYIVGRYVWVMERHPRVGYAFCPGVGVKNGHETGVLAYSVHGDHDRIFGGHTLLRTLIASNSVIAASGMVRRECYERLGVFPLDDGMEWTGDWYLWCMFALFYDVAYFAEAMVCYRQHSASMTNTLMRPENLSRCSVGDVAVPWMIKQKAEAFGFHTAARWCLKAIAHEYARQCTASKDYLCNGRIATLSMTVSEFEDSLGRKCSKKKERAWIRARVFAGMADVLLSRRDTRLARALYVRGLCADPLFIDIYVKLCLLALGRPGWYCRYLLGSLRRGLRNFVALIEDDMASEYANGTCVHSPRPR